MPVLILAWEHDFGEMYLNVFHFNISIFTTHFLLVTYALYLIFFPPSPLVSCDGQLFHFLHYLRFTFSTQNHFGLMQTWLFHTFLPSDKCPKEIAYYVKSRYKCHIRSYFLRMDCFSLRLWPWKELPTTRSKLQRNSHGSHLLHKIATEVDQI